MNPIDGKVSGAVSPVGNVKGAVSQLGSVKGDVSTAKTGTKNYEELHNKPMINGEVLVGDKSIEQLGVETLSNMEIKQIFDRVFKKGE